MSLETSYKPGAFAVIDPRSDEVISVHEDEAAVRLTFPAPQPVTRLLIAKIVGTIDPAA